MVEPLPLSPLRNAIGRWPDEDELTILYAQRDPTLPLLSSERP